MNFDFIYLTPLSILFFIIMVFYYFKYRKIRNRFATVISVEDEYLKAEKALSETNESILQTRNSYAEKRKMLIELEKQVAVYDESLSFVEMGVYNAHFDYGDSEEYKTKIKEIRAKQKLMVSRKTAIFCPTNWEVDGSKSKGKAMLNRQVRLTLRAFNNECEAAIANARWNNVVAMEKRILNAAKQIDSANSSMNLKINQDYVSLKLDELFHAHEYREQLKIEKDERAELARAERDEKRLIAEAQAAEREEKKYQTLLNKARKEASIDESKIKELQAALDAAHAKAERAKAMAEFTRSGYVYVISNIGSFGDNVVKIGLTRRLDPNDRVKELGDASVPFGFDTHAMIYSDDAPALEKALHNEFASKRINASNMRKEFFATNLKEVEFAVQKLAPESQFFKDREAQEWHETLAIRNQVLSDMQRKSDEFPSEI